MKTSEKRLLIATVVMAVIGLNYIIGIRLLRKSERSEDQKHQLELKTVEAEVLLEQREIWLQKSAWLDKSQPPFLSVEAAETDLLKTAQTAESKGLEIVLRRFEPIKNVGHITRGSVSMKVKGNLENLLGWLHEIQQPGKFQSVRKIRIEPGRDDVSVLDCALTVDRWYGTAESEAG